MKNCIYQSQRLTNFHEITHDRDEIDTKYKIKLYQFITWDQTKASAVKKSMSLLTILILPTPKSILITPRQNLLQAFPLTR
jgi:hypothetical protein